MFGFGIHHSKYGSEIGYKGILEYNHPALKKFRAAVKKGKASYALPQCFMVTKTKKEWMRLVTNSAAEIWDYANGPDGN
jgi:hypothetical protein